MRNFSQIRTLYKAMIVCLLSVGWVACSTFIPREGWNPQYGAVVPHDSFPGDCSICHVSDDWNTIKKGFSFDHGKETGVKLVGAHKNASCLLCHNDRGPVARYSAQGCAGCHTDTHRGKLGNSCQECHNQETWRPKEQIARHSRTRFPLVGAHAASACFECHKGAQVGNFEGLDVQCSTCHMKEYTKTTNPNHLSAGFGTDCQTCHTPISFKGNFIAHPSSFPLTRGHSGQNCSACHQVGTFKGLSTDCASCHMQNYQQTTDPNHVTAGFGTDCKSCHNTGSWRGANFQHTPTFALTGGHAGHACSRCHTGGVFTGLSTNCVTCHQQDYNGAKNPNHLALGFSTDCKSCHKTVNTWKGAKFNHSFPITTGAHKNFNCTDCHLNPGNQMQFSCTHCHEHRKSEADKEHKDVGGYIWSSPSCFACHPKGKD